MVVIFSSKNDISTNQVIDWLKHFNRKYIRINFPLTVSEISDLILDILSSKETKIWIRRFNFPLFTETNLDIVEKAVCKEKQQLIMYYLDKALKDGRLLGNHYNLISNNKLLNLDLAKEVGMLVPKWTIIAKTEGLYIYDNYITKPIYEGISLRLKDKSYFTYTSKVSEIDGLLTEKKVNICPSFVQEFISKIADIRIFFICGETYGLKIFSQANSQTQVDFRKYSTKNPSRKCPIMIPAEIIKKIRLFCKKLNINTGSFDFVENNKGELLFLEVNPIGQFGMVSYPGNYQLERKIAQFLTNSKNLNSWSK